MWWHWKFTVRCVSKRILKNESIFHKVATQKWRFTFGTTSQWHKRYLHISQVHAINEIISFTVDMKPPTLPRPPATSADITRSEDDKDDGQGDAERQSNHCCWVSFKASLCHRTHWHRTVSFWTLVIIIIIIIIIIISTGMRCGRSCYGCWMWFHTDVVMTMLCDRWCRSRLSWNMSFHSQFITSAASTWS